MPVRFRLALGVVFSVGILAFAGCSTATQNASSSPSPSASPAAAAPPLPLANGSSIFHTGLDAAGVQIVASTHPLRPSCEACHGADGSGGVHLPGGAVSADLRHAALVTGQKHPYTLALLERAISTGIDNDGMKLDPAMPRWKLSKQDLRDVAKYVLTL